MYKHMLTPPPMNYLLCLRDKESTDLKDQDQESSEQQYRGELFHVFVKYSPFAEKRGQVSIRLTYRHTQAVLFETEEKHIFF